MTYINLFHIILFMKIKALSIPNEVIHQKILLIRGHKVMLDKEHKPDGYNIGINVGESAGQTVWHVHVHVIPRFKGDMNDPRGGVRGVIPDKQKY